MVEQATAEYCDAVSDAAGGAPSPELGVHDAAAARSADLDTIEAELAAVEAALNRLDAGTYWTDEVTGETLADSLLEENPLLRRRPL